MWSIMQTDFPNKYEIKTNLPSQWPNRNKRILSIGKRYMEPNNKHDA